MNDDEIIISVNLKDRKDIKNNKRKTKKNKKKNVRTSKTIRKNATKKNLKFISLLFLIIISSILLFYSSIFNIKYIYVNGNNKLSDEKVISLSSLSLYTNMFKFKKNDIVNNIKRDAYIEDASITRKLPNTVEININERTINYMLQFADSYVYINNQGYMLEISNERVDVPILVGLTTDLSNIKAGNRVNEEDLKKMNVVIKIYELAKSNELSEFITKMDISNDKNYSIEMQKKGKIVYLGDCSNYSDLNTRMVYLKSILEASEGISGEIFLNVDLNTQKVWLKPSS